MRHASRLLLVWSLMTLSVMASAEQVYTIRMAPMLDVDLTDDFWARRLKMNREVTVQHVFDQFQETGWLDRLRSEDGTRTAPYDGAVWKAVEGVAYILARHPDPALEERVLGLIRRAIALQEPDGDP